MYLQNLPALNNNIAMQIVGLLLRIFFIVKFLGVCAGRKGENVGEFGPFIKKGF